MDNKSISKQVQFYEEVYSQDFNVDDIPHGWVQWKGTNVCIDLQCKCGYLGHVDAEFFYHYDCPKCHRKYAVGQNVKLIELNKDQIEEVIKNRCPFVSCALEEFLDV